MKRLVVLILTLCACLAGAVPSGRVAYTPYGDAKPILDTLAEIAPFELRANAASDGEAAWNAWAVKRDAEIRARLARGDADSVVNFLLFGTSFTRAPRLTGEQLRSLSDGANGATPDSGSISSRALLEKRVKDLTQSTNARVTNERVGFAKKTMEAAGVDFSQPEAAQRAGGYLRENVQRVLREQAGFEQALAEAKNLNDATEEFAEVSKLYKDRGLSLDTSLPPDFAIEETLKEMRATGVLGPGSIKRIGVIGPGLDFTDKHEGYDFYPVQTVQPFAVADSVLRLGLGRPENLEVDVLDLSPRVLRHATNLAAEARRGRSYTIQLGLDAARGWHPELVEYWRHFGDQIGTPEKPAAVPAALKGITLRAVSVRPQIAGRMKSFDADIVLQRAKFTGDAEKFDLLIATNILVYYDTFEQSLALTNVAAMLKPGGFLLTNNLLLELPGTSMKSVGHVSVKYSEKASDGDTIVKYRRTN
ncbi:MAG TPA: class I SAM-dependent methyltransferase [Candidatus Acidoferrum sp.]|nr:class I SAM-dependent methyltransferase [Candidatus Acidoferrum sp.]